MGADSVEEMLEEYSRGGEPELDAAPLALEHAARGDAVAVGIIEWAAGELGGAASTVAGRLEMDGEPYELVLSGGLFRGGGELLETLISRAVPTALLTRLEVPPVSGAVLMALELIGGRPTPDVHERCSRASPPPSGDVYQPLASGDADRPCALRLPVLGAGGLHGWIAQPPAPVAGRAPDQPGGGHGRHPGGGLRAHARIPSSAVVLPGIAAGLSGVAAALAFYRAMSIGSISVAAPILATGAVVPVVAGLATGERPGRSRWPASSRRWSAWSSRHASPIRVGAACGARACCSRC